MLKFTNSQKTAATFGDLAFILAAPVDWESIGDGPSRVAVLKWLADGNTPPPADPDQIPSPTSVIEGIERQSMEKAIAVGAARTPPLTAVQSIAVLRAGNAGYRKVKELDEQIVTERAKL